MSTVVGTGVVRVAPDLTGFHAKIRAAAQQIKDIKVGIDVDTKAAAAKIAAVRAEARAAAKDVTIKVDVDAGAAVAELVALRGALDGIEGGGDRDGLGGVSKSAIRASTALGRLATGTGPLLLGVLSLAPPVATLAGGLAAVAAPLSAALVGGGLFAFLAGKYVGKTDEVLGQIESLRKKAKETTDAGKRADYLKQAEDLERGLTKSQLAFSRAKDGLKAAFADLSKGKAGDALLEPITSGMGLLTKLLPKVSPLITSVSKALTDMIAKLSTPAAIKSFDGFIGSLSKLAGPAISSIGSILGSTGSAFASFLKAAAPLGQGILDHIAESMKNLATYLKSPAGQEKLQAFFDWVKLNGPIVWQAIKDIGTGFVEAGRAIAPFAVAALRVVGLSAKAIGGIVPIVGKVGQLIAAIAGAILGMVGYAATGLGNLLGKLANVPHFGWVKGVADGLKDVGTHATGAANDIARLNGSKAAPFVAVPPGAKQTSKDSQKALIDLLVLGTTHAGPSVRAPKGASETSSDAKNAHASLTNLGKVNVSPRVNPTKLGPAIKESDDLGASHGRLKGKDIKIALNSLSGPIGQANDLASAIARLHDKDVTVTTHYRTTGSKPAASGRLVTGPQRILVGEAGPEAIVPLDRNLNAVDPSVRWLSAIAQGKSMRQSVAMPSGSKPTGGGGDRPIEFNVHPQAGQSETEIGKAAANRLMFALQGAGR